MIRLKEYDNEQLNIVVKSSQKEFVMGVDKIVSVFKSTNNTKLLLCVIEDEVVGLCLYRVNTEYNNIFLWQLLIDSQYQGNGYGKTFLGLVEEYILREESYQRVVTTYKEGNEVSRKLFSSLGYLEFSTDEDEVNMEKTLKPVIKRIDSYNDSRFSRKVLNQHGAYTVNNVPCSFEVISKDEAIVDYSDRYLDEAIELFRFYTGHVSTFYNKSMEVIAQFDPVSFRKVLIDDLQPSQFYVSQAKLDALSSWMDSGENIVVPILKGSIEKVLMDGHSRIYLAKVKGIKHVYVYEEENENVNDLFHFVKEAKLRGIRSIAGLKRLTHEEYIDVWYKYCDDYFNGQ